MNIAGFDIDLDTFRRFAGHALPRHVAYPMPTWWTDVDGDEASALLRESRQRAPVHDLSLYLHVPFCEHICTYCACNRVALSRKSPRSAERTREYVGLIVDELQQVCDTLGAAPPVRQIHWGGGTPTYLSCDQLTRIHEALAAQFPIAADAEIAIELDPRVTSREMLTTLRRLGFNRLSMGVQDFDPRVQEHVRRVQPFELVRDVVATARALGFPSINFDLIYGLPYQSPESIRDTIAKTIALAPDRIAYYHFAQIPDKIAVQRGLDIERLPDSETKLEMFLLGLQLFPAGGYEFIGLDHFARPDEPLAVAKRNGTLQRNFQGMTTGGGLDLIGVGVSSISHLSGVGYLQNVRDLGEYTQRVAEGRSPIFRGKRFTEDDCIRQEVLGQIYCEGRIARAAVEQKFGIDFDEYFAREIAIMHELADEGLVRVNDDIELTLPLGRVLMRTVAAVFDAYLDPDAYKAGDREYFSANA